MTAQQDYRFTATVTWNPPVYPFKRILTYIREWSREGDISSVSSSDVSEIIFSHNMSCHVMIIIFAHVVSKANFAPPFPCRKTINTTSSFPSSSYYGGTLKV